MIVSFDSRAALVERHQCRLFQSEAELEKWIANREMLNLLTVLKVFGVENGAVQRNSCHPCSVKQSTNSS